MKSFYRLIIFQALLVCAVNTSANDVRNYDWLSNGIKTGSLVVTTLDDGSRNTSFEFKDRGRGPSIQEKIRFHSNGPGIGLANGLVVELEVSGHSYMGAPVKEYFSRNGNNSAWSSTIETGNSSNSASAYYLANDQSPEQTALLARALLASPDSSIELLPAGTASIRKLSKINGAHLFAIHGLGFNPSFIWLDENDELFGLSAGSNALVPSGRTDMAALMKVSQDTAKREYLKTRSMPLTNKLPGIYAINNVHVVDVLTGVLLANHSVTVIDGRISAVSPMVSELDGIEVIDGEGGYLIPGLWDMHTHISLEQGLLHIAAGVTTVRDMGNNPDNYHAVKAGYDSGEVIGPRSFAAGIVEGKSPFSAPIKELAESAEEAVALVSQYAEMGYPQIKIYSSLHPDWVRPVVNKAHELGMRVSGHVPAFMNAEQAVLAGYDEIQHINFLFLNFLASNDDDTRTPLRFLRVAERGGDLDLESKTVTAFVNLLKDRQVVVDPTVSIFVNMFTHRSGELSPGFRMIADRLPPSERRSLLAGRMDVNDENAGVYAKSSAALLEMVKKLYQSGVTIVAGTDALAGFGLHRELELYQQAGIPPPEVLKIATLGAAQVMGAGDRLGSVSVGKQADFVLLAANPLEDISAVRTTRLVFKGDRYFESRRLYQAIGVRPAN